MESPLKYDPAHVEALTLDPDRVREQCQAGSLTGAVASQKVTEAPKGSLRLVGNQPSSAMAQGSLTVRLTSRAGAKAGHSDPAIACGSVVAQRIKGTPGITGLSLPSVHSGGAVWRLDVGSSHPGAVGGPKGWAVRPFKRYASWVQTGVSQVGPYLPWS